MNDGGLELPRSLFYGRDGEPITRDRWFELLGQETYKRVALTEVGTEPLVVAVSTVWLGIDYSFGEAPQPVIFETMVFGGPLDGECVRTPTSTEAQAAHDAMVTLVTAELEVAGL